MVARPFGHLGQAAFLRVCPVEESTRLRRVFCHATSQLRHESRYSTLVAFTRCLRYQLHRCHLHVGVVVLQMLHSGANCNRASEHSTASQCTETFGATGWTLFTAHRACNYADLVRVCIEAASAYAVDVYTC